MPFGFWKKKVDEYRRKVEYNIRLVYFYPLNLDIDHFTLLKINEPLRTIYHYNLIAGQDVIRGKTTYIRIRRMVEVG